MNSNPATIMTDPEYADVTYIEPLTIEALEKIIRKEKPMHFSYFRRTNCTQFVNGLKQPRHIKKYNVEMIGAKPEAIEKGEAREVFKQAMLKSVWMSLVLQPCISMLLKLLTI